MSFTRACSWTIDVLTRLNATILYNSFIFSISYSTHFSIVLVSLLVIEHNLSSHRTEAPEALQRAKDNIDKYLVVGVLDRYTDFLHVLECLLPRYFKGIKEMYKSKCSCAKSIYH